MNELNKPDLFQWQTEFSTSLLNQLNDSLKNSFMANSEFAKEQRFAIYQNNVFYSLTNALGDLYPVVKKLVGDDFFTGTATYYLRQNPPKQAAMVHFGHDFVAFLADFEHTKTLDYLAPVAQLELHQHLAYHAADIDPLAVDHIASITPEELLNKKVNFHPSLLLLNSPHPALTIWETNQDNKNEKKDVHLNEPQWILTVRQDYKVTNFIIDQTSYIFFNELQHGNTIGEAITLALEQEPEFDISQAIFFLTQQQLLISIN